MGHSNCPRGAMRALMFYIETVCHVLGWSTEMRDIALLRIDSGGRQSHHRPVFDWPSSSFAIPLEAVVRNLIPMSRQERHQKRGNT